MSKKEARSGRNSFRNEPNFGGKGWKEKKKEESEILTALTLTET